MVKLYEIEEVKGYKENILKRILYYILVIASFGIVYLLARWSTRLWALLRVTECETFIADYFIIRGSDQIKCIVASEQFLMGGLRHIGFKYRLYTFIYKNGGFKLVEFHAHQLNSDYHKQDYYSMEQLKDAQVEYGINCTLVPNKPLLTIIVDELINPLFVFDCLILILWIWEGYVFYSIVVLLLSIVTILETLLDYQQNQLKLQALQIQSTQVTVIRQGNAVVIDSIELVPGETIIIQPNLVIPCDAILVEGTCIINEQILTGDTNPINKHPLINNNQKFNIAQCQSSYLYQSTTCIHSSNRCTAYTIATGFDTQKGQLIRRLQYNKDMSHSHYQDCIKYLKYLSVVAIIGYLITLPFKIKILNKYPSIPRINIIIDALDLFAVCVPPTLPTSLQIGLNMGLKALKQYGIFCVQPHKIYVAGGITQMCFDKSGTLTESDTQLYGIVTVDSNNTFSQLSQIEDTPHIALLMGVCNSLLLGASGQLSGDQLEKTLFIASKSEYIEQCRVRVNNVVFEVVQRSDYKTELQRMSVVVKQDNGYVVYLKGAPDIVKELCIRHSIPRDYSYLYKLYAHNGFKVIACAQKQMDELVDDRDKYENDLVFMGFIIMDNKVKQTSQDAIVELINANISTTIITGDNLLVSIRVAKSCGILGQQRIMYAELSQGANGKPEIDWKDYDQEYHRLEDQLNDQTRLLFNNNAPMSKLMLEAQSNKQLDQGQSIKLIDEEQLEPLYHDDSMIAISGQVFMHFYRNAQNTINYSNLDMLIKRTSIFAKMKPEYKEILINYMKHTKIVGFCGDGVNDLLSLMTADVGVSLTEAKLSIAAPFTSESKGIQCIPNLLQECRASLSISFYTFKYVTLTSLTQFVSCLILYFNYSFMSNNQYLIIDLLVIFPLSILPVYTQTLKPLTKDIPQQSLLSTTVLSSIIGLSIIQLLYQVIVYLVLINMDWFIDCMQLSGNTYDEDWGGFKLSFEATSLFLITNFQYTFMSFVLQIDNQFRQQFYTNQYYTFYLLIIFIFQIYLLLFTWRSDGIEALGLTYRVELDNQVYEMPQSWILFMTFIVILNSISTIVYELYGVQYVVKLVHKLFDK